MARAGSWLLASLVAAALALDPASALARRSPDLTPRSPAEREVLKQLETAGAVVFPYDRTAPRISAEFFRGLLTTKEPDVMPRLDRLSMTHVTVVGDVDMLALEVPRPVYLQFVRFEGRVTFSTTRFSRGLALLWCTFAGSADLGAMAIDGNLFLDGTRFATGLSMPRARISGSLFARRSLFEGKGLNLSALGADGDVFLSRSRVRGPLDLDDARIGGRLDFGGTTVEGATQMTRSTVGRQVVFEPNGRRGYQSRAATASTDACAQICGSVCGGGCSRDQAEPSVDCRTCFAFQDGCRQAECQGSSDESLVIPHFSGDVIMTGSSFGALIVKELGAAGRLAVNEAKIQGSVFLRASSIAKDLSLQDSEISGNVELRAGKLGSLTLKNARVGVNVTCSGTAIRGQAVLRRVTLGGGLDYRCDVGSTGTLDLGGARVTGLTSLAMRLGNQGPGSLKLTDARFSTLNLSALVNPQGQEHNLSLTGMSYDRLVTGSGGYRMWAPQAHLVALLERAEFSPQIYTSMAEWLKKEGATLAADEVFLDGKRRELEETRKTWKGDRWGTWLTSLLKHCLYWVVTYLGYGKIAWGAIVAGVALWFAGFLAFFRGRIEARTSDDGSRVKVPSAGLKRSALYSLDTMLPSLIDFRHAEILEPRPGWRRPYLVFHQSAGRVVAVFLFAALAGIIK